MSCIYVYFPPIRHSGAEMSALSSAPEAPPILESLAGELVELHLTRIHRKVNHSNEKNG